MISREELKLAIEDNVKDADHDVVSKTYAKAAAVAIATIEPNCSANSRDEKLICN